MFEDEIKRILKMVEEGKLSPDEGAKLIEALDAKEKKKGKVLRIYVLSPDGDEVNIRIPLKLIKFAKKFIPKKFHNIGLGEDMEFDVSQFVEEIGTEVGEYLDVKTEEGDIIKISVE